MHLELKKFYEQIQKGKAPAIVAKRYADRLKLSAELAKDGLSLDIGCRHGHLRNYLASEYVGLDITSKHFENGFHKVVADACHLPFKGKIFDNVFCLELLEHLIMPEKCLREVKKVLKPDGFLILTVPNIACLLNRIRIPLGREPTYFELGAGHLQCFTYSSLRDFLSQKGFIITKRQTIYMSIPPRRLFHSYRLTKYLAKLFPNLNDNILVRCQQSRGE